MVEIISVHIPKTAGRAFLSLLKQVYGPDHILEDYNDLIANPKSQYNIDRARWEGEKERFIKGIASTVSVIHGHFALQKYDRHFPSAKRIAWIRDPLSRLFSNYHFLKSEPPEGADPWRKYLYRTDFSFMEFAESPLSQNPITGQFLKGAKIEDLYFVGIQEFFIEDVMDLKEMLHWPEIKISFENENSHPEYRKKYFDLMNDRSLIKKIESLNARDVEFYRDALGLRAKRRRDRSLNHA